MLMVNGVGIDIVSIERIRKIYETYKERFLNRILTEKEIKTFKERNSNIEFLAGRFAVKEAITKILEKPIPFKEMEITYENSKPVFKNSPNILISISHDSGFAIAIAIRMEL